MRPIIALIVVASFIVVLDAQCPEPSALKDPNGNKICARLFADSHYVFEQSCGGESLDVFVGDDVPIMPYRWRNRASSLVVATRCTLSVWSRVKKEGKKRNFSAGIQYRLKDVGQGLFGNWNNDIEAYYCDC